MKNYNRFLLRWFLTGNIAVFTGAIQKLSGNVHYHYAIYAGLLIQLFVLIFFVLHNYQRLKSFVLDLAGK